MEPRARAGKNVGKMNFGYGELRQLLYGCGDVREPLPDTMRLLDEIATDFIQGLSFEAARVAHYAGRQKIKYEDFEFALRRNPLFLGKVREMFEMSKEVKDARKMPGIGEGNLGKADVNELAKLGGIGEDATREAGVRGATDGDGGGADGQGSTVAVPQKRKYNKTGESKKKKKAKLAALAAAGKGADGGLFGNGAADADPTGGTAASASASAPASVVAAVGGGDAVDGRSSVAPASAVGADEGDDLADLDDDIDAELR